MLACNKPHAASRNSSMLEVAIAGAWGCFYPMPEVAMAASAFIVDLGYADSRNNTLIQSDRGLAVGLAELCILSQWTY